MGRLRGGWAVLGPALGVAAAPMPGALVATGTLDPASLQVIVNGEK
jgi:hypothetical protein